MKKVILTALLLAAFSTSALAIDKTDLITGSTTIGSMQFSASNNVYLNGASSASSYFFESLHTSGSRVFSTDEAASIIYWRDATITSTTTAVTAGFTGSVTAATAASGNAL